MRIGPSCLLIVSTFAFSSLMACGGDHHDAQNASDVPAASTPSTTGATQSTNPPSSASDPGTSTQTGSTTPNASATTPGISDGEILGVTDAANQGEIDQAKLAFRKSQDANVRNLAKQMQSDHTDAMKKLDSTAATANITTATSSMRATLTTDSTAALDKLSSASGKDFDKQYVDLQVKEHQDVLDTLDQKLIPAASNADFKNALKETRAKVAQHLQMAKDLQMKLAAAK